MLSNPMRQNMEMTRNPTGPDTAQYEQWGAAEVAQYFSQAGLKDYAHVFLEHKISGKLAVLLQDADLKEMGFKIVGDRLRMKEALRNLKFAARKSTRNREIWRGSEHIPKDCNWICCQCCGTFTPYPATYKLTGSNLKIFSTVVDTLCGMKCGCMGYTHHTNNIDLSMVKDVDLSGEAPACIGRCCFCEEGSDLIVISVESHSGEARDNHVLLPHGEGQRVADLIIDMREEAHLRDARGAREVDVA